MTRIKNFTLKASKTRKRVQKFRKLKKLRETYERQYIEHDIEFNCDDSSNDFDRTNESFQSNSFCLKEKLSVWAVQHRITKSAVNDLLSILIMAGFSFLPKDSRTLLRTPQQVEIKPLSSGKLWYYGTENCLLNILSKVDKSYTIHLDFNFDGMQLFNSSKLTFWPMLASIQGDCNQFILYFEVLVHLFGLL